MKLDYQEALKIVGENNLSAYQARVDKAHEYLHQGTGQGSDFIGWLDLPVNYDKEEFDRVKKAAAKIREQAEVLIVIGIGGSYIGARAGLEMITSNFANQMDKTKLKVYFAGNTISSSYLCDLLDVIGDKEIAVNVISKSGTTLEPAVAFRVFRQLLEKKYGKEGARERIYVTTDKARGALKTLSDQEGYETFTIADDIGGRFSVLTSVGLLPLAAAGLDIDKMMEGACAAREEYSDPDLNKNVCYQYAAMRRLLEEKGDKKLELLVSYEPDLLSFSEWWKQLYGESEGKDGKGLFPGSVSFSTDLHSLGQFIQDGTKVLFETVLRVEKPKRDLALFSDKDNLDGLNYLADKTLSEVNEKAFLGTLYAHQDGGVPNLIIRIPEMNEFYFGKMVYFFEKACGISSYMLDVNPFNQPGVEAYKKNMFKLLGKK